MVRSHTVYFRRLKLRVFSSEAVLPARFKIGSPSEAVPEFREYPIARTPFILNYQLRPNEIRTLQVKDQHSARPTRLLR